MAPSRYQACPPTCGAAAAAVIAFASGFALSAALIAAISAQNTFVLRQGLRREYVGSVVLFCAGADIALVTAGVAGLGAALKRMPGLQLMLTLACGLLLRTFASAA